MGMYFFMSDKMEENTRQAMGILGMLAEFGGMQGLVVVIVTLLMETFNDG